MIFGCVDQVGAQALNVARQAWLSAGLPESVPGTTLDRQCGSSQQAAHFAAQGVMAGAYDLVVAGGVENMSMVPIGSPVPLGAAAGYGDPFGSEGWQARYGDQEISQFRGAELIAAQWGFEREELEAFALESHRRAAQAWEAGRFDREVAAYAGVERDEGVRAGRLAGEDGLPADAGERRRDHGRAREPDRRRRRRAPHRLRGRGRARTG